MHCYAGKDIDQNYFRIIIINQERFIVCSLKLNWNIITKMFAVKMSSCNNAWETLTLMSGGDGGI